MTITDAAASAFSALHAQPADPLLALIGLHRDDPRPDKIDLGVGVYRDDEGYTPVMAAVKAAEAKLQAEQDTKSYLGADGDMGFVSLLAPIVLGDAWSGSPLITGVQTPGGGGALRLGAELLALALPQATVWMGQPTWPNHAPIFTGSGLTVREHAYYDAGSGGIAFAAMMRDLQELARGDILLLHGCCHNPTGTSLSDDQWLAIADLAAQQGAVVFVDLAYQGLGNGLDEDAAGLRRILDRLPDVLVAYSCDKNFGLYRERVGALWVKSGSMEQTEVVRANLLALARVLWSMPPDHGAAVVRLILEDGQLTEMWRRELEIMRGRLRGLRKKLADAHPALAPLGQQDGLFAMLPIDHEAVTRARHDHGVYMASSGRINIAGLTAQSIPQFVRALSEDLPMKRREGSQNL